MSSYKLLLAEIKYRRGNFALCLVAVAAAATLLVAGPLIVDGFGRQALWEIEGKKAETKAELAEMQQKMDAELKEFDKQTKRTMRDLGFNLRIVHKDTDMAQLYMNFLAHDMPESYVQRLAESSVLTKVVHLVPSLKQKITWEGRARLLVGFAPEVTQTHVEKKLPMGLKIKRGEVNLGHEAAVGHKLGETVTILDRPFTVAKILSQQSNENDVMIALNLKDAQELLGKQGKISEILALGCKCEKLDRISEITTQLEQVLPEAKITEMGDRATARENQRNLVVQSNRRTTERYKAGREKVVADAQEELAMKRSRDEGLLYVIRPLIVLVAAAVVALMTWTNVRERRTEIGLLRALGRDAPSIAKLFLGKALLVGLLGGLVGCSLGLLATAVVGWANQFNMALPGATAVLIATTLLGAPLVAAIASYLPTRVAVDQDPAVVLMER